jgi:hypothetical protein
VPTREKGDAPREDEAQEGLDLWLDLNKKAKDTSTRGDQGPGEGALRRTQP